MIMIVFFKIPLIYRLRNIDSIVVYVSVYGEIVSGNDRLTPLYGHDTLIGRLVVWLSCQLFK